MVSAQVAGHHADRVVYQVATLAPPGPVAARLSAIGIQVHSLGGGGWVARALALHGLLRRERFDIVNAYGFKASMLAKAVLRASPDRRDKRPILICGVRGLHTTEVENVRSLKARTVALAERCTKRWVDQWDANSPGAVAFIASLGVSHDRIRYIPNGIELAQWPVGIRAPANPSRILCVSRFVARKRQADLILALARARDQGIDVRVDFVGEGPTFEDVRALTVSLALQDRVCFHGTLGHDAIRDLMARASLFCLVSTHEGMPGAVMEAMAAGLPVVGTDVNGTSAVVSDRETGYLVPAGAPDQLAEALIDCVSDPQKMLTMGQAARRRIEEHFSLDAMIDRKEALYREVLGMAA